MDREVTFRGVRPWQCRHLGPVHAYLLYRASEHLGALAIAGGAALGVLS